VIAQVDAAGRWQTKYPKVARKAKPLPIDASFVLADGRSFDDFIEFKTLIAADPKTLARNFASQLLVYGTGAEIEFLDRAAIDQIVAKTAKNNDGIRDLIHAVVVLHRAVVVLHRAVVVLHRVGRNDSANVSTERVVQVVVCRRRCQDARKKCKVGSAKSQHHGFSRRRRTFFATRDGSRGSRSTGRLLYECSRSRKTNETITSFRSTV
jgi:hypothetical protein